MKKGTTRGATSGKGGACGANATAAPTLSRLEEQQRRAKRALDRRKLLAALTAFRKGSFDARLPEDFTGIDGKIAGAFNAVVEQNQRMTQALERLSRAVGKEGRITERASLPDMTGSWGESVSSVNALITDLVLPTHETARVIDAVAKGDLSQTIALETEGRPLQGEFLRTAKTVNAMVDQLSSFASGVTRVAREVGTEENLGGQARVDCISGTWKDLTAQVQQQARTLEQKALQLQRLTEASLAINSALSPDEMLHTVTDLARDILGAHQAVAVAAVDQKWSHPISAVSLSARYQGAGERLVFRDRAELLAFLSQTERSVRVPRSGAGAPDGVGPLFTNDRPASLGWLAAPLSARDGRPLGVLHVLEKRDGEFTPEDEAILIQLAQVTSIAIENTLNAEALEANRIKDEFLTTLSHELRTPLSAILGWTRTLRTAPADQEKLDHGLEVIERNVRAQTKLIDDLLDVSRIITGKLRLSVRPVNVAPIIEAAIEAMRPAALAKEIQISVERDVRTGDDVIVGDPDRLQQVVWNLVSNAIKFTRAGGAVTVLLRRYEGQFEIRVSDTGRGISQDFLPRVFERFRQADSTTTRVHGGLGIGLAIARHLVELHGGSISADSAGEQQGAVFTVSLPDVALGIRGPGSLAPEEPVEAPASEEIDVDLEGVRVLIVEDEPDGRELLKEVLTAAGANVACSASASQARARFRTELPDVLVSDIGMPEEDGYALIRTIRSMPASAGGTVPAIAVTAYAREEDRLRALAAGFQAHVPKPVDPAELVKIVGRLATGRGRHKDDSASSQSRRPAPPPSDDDKGHSTLPRILVVEDDIDSREGLRSLLETWGHDVDLAEDGRKGIEQAIARRPGVALIDIGLPDLDGYEVARRIREALGKNGIYLVALTGYTDAGSRQKALESGFDAHVAKPIDSSKLEALLESRRT